MEQPETLLFPDDNGNVYTVKSSYEDLKAGIYIQQGIETWNEILRMWYRELLFNYRFESSMEELKKIGAVNKGSMLPYSVDDIHNSLVFIRTKIVKELGNGALSNLNEEVQQMWRDMEKKAEQRLNN